MSKLLMDETPLMVLPSLATAIGLNEAIVLQQLHYLTLGKFGKIIEGRRYIYNTLEKWRDTYFPFWTVKTTQRTFKALEKAGYIVSMQERSYYRQKLYAVDYVKLDAIRTNCPHPSGQIVHMEQDKLSTSIQREDSTKTTGATADAAPVIVGTTQQPSIMATEIVNSTALQEKKDGVTEFFNLAVAAKTNRKIITAWRGAEHLKDVCITLCDVTGLSVTKGDSGKWLKGATALYELGATADIFKRVWDEATERDRQFLTHPAAFVERVRGAKAKPAPLTHPAPTRAFEWRQNEAGEMYRHYTDSEVQA
jgi:hypothetical protein